jgi:hypothetical protein
MRVKNKGKWRKVETRRKAQKWEGDIYIVFKKDWHQKFSSNIAR